MSRGRIGAAFIFGLVAGASLVFVLLQGSMRARSERFASLFEIQNDLLKELPELYAKHDIRLLDDLRNGREEEAIARLAQRVDDHFARLEERGDLKALAELRSYAEPRPPEPCDDDCQRKRAWFAGARVLPRFESGSVVGLRVTHIVPGSPWEDLGLEEGVVIASVDGMPVDSADSSARVLVLLADGARFGVRRDESGRVHLEPL